jgi:membrane-bound lytic murein transglycosylase B
MAALSDPEVKEFFWQKVSKSHNVKRDRYDRWVERKTKWAYAELKAFLKYSYRENIDPVKVRGSYAGALGIAQFMPTSIMAYATDGNKDGRIDLFTHGDAIASVANYLKSHGWRPGIDQKAKHKVIWYYNRSDYYVNAIFKISDLLKETA